MLPKIVRIQAHLSPDGLDTWSWGAGCVKDAQLLFVFLFTLQFVKTITKNKMLEFFNKVIFYILSSQQISRKGAFSNGFIFAGQY